MSLKTNIIDNLKNIVGWKTQRKLVVFSVDDYGNVRLGSKAARCKLNDAGMGIISKYDVHDTLESREDLEMLFDALRSVKDSQGNHAVFTPFAVPCNINFEKVLEAGDGKYYYEKLPQTYAKLGSSYSGTWTLWQQGINDGIMMPQFHGREHLHLKTFTEKLNKKDHNILTALKNRSYTSIFPDLYPTVKYTAAFQFWDFEENKVFEDIIEDGLACFEDVFGYKATHFNPPSASAHSVLNKKLKECGIRYIDKTFVENEHQGQGRYKKKIHFTGESNKFGQTYIVRNVVFEPTEDSNIDWAAFAMKQIETAFRWRRPAIISSHRVNFCGEIDSNNRRIGINSLKDLLKRIVYRWPDVEFISADMVGNLIEHDK